MQIAHRAPSRRVDQGVVGGSLDAVVPGPVVIRAVQPALAVRVVVLAVVGRQVGQGEAVMGRDEVERRDGPAVEAAEQVLGTGEPGGEVAHAVARLARDRSRQIAEPERPHGVPEAVVPLGQGWRELPGPPAVHPEVPGLGDQLDARQDRVRPQCDEERVRRVIRLVPPPRERHREVEAEPVDVALPHPVAQRVEHHPGHDGMGQVERVAAPGDVNVLPSRIEPVVGAGVEPSPRHGHAVLGLLSGVVVDDVEDHLDARRVEQLDHAFELVDDPLRIVGRGIAGVRREEAEGVVAPVVRQTARDELGLVGEGVDRQQLDSGDTQALEVRHEGRMCQTGIGAAEVLRKVGVERGRVLHVDLVDHRLCQ